MIGTTLQRSSPGEALSLLDRAVIGTVLLFAMLLGSAQFARATEVIPFVGITRAAVTDDNSKISYGLAVRGNLAPILMAEIAGSYRTEEHFGGDLNVTQWPVSASLWLKPLPMFYAGGGVGWYQTTLDYDQRLPFADETKQEFGVHLGGGLSIPLAPKVGLDLNGRYVFLEDIDQKLSTEKFDPDFWTTSLGLAIKF